MCHTSDSVRVCLSPVCSRRLSGNFSTASNGVSFLTLATDFDVGNCTRGEEAFPRSRALRPHRLCGAGRKLSSGIKTKGTYQRYSHDHWHVREQRPANVGLLAMDPDVDPGECDRLSPLCGLCASSGRRLE